MRNFKLFIFYATFLFFGYACQKSQQVSEVVDNDSIAEKATEDLKVNDVMTRFPPPSEMLAIMDKIQSEYIDGILNDASNHKNYFDSRTQALNIGVYSADLAYLSYEKKFKESISYFNALYSLSDKLEISAAFRKETVKRFQNNITNADSLQHLMDNSIRNLSDYLEANNNERVFAVISIGGYIEALYLSFKIVDEFSEENPFIQRIADQKYVLENIIGYSSQFGDDPMVQGAVDLIKPVKDVYDGLNVTENETVVEKTPDGKLIVKGGNLIEITEEQYNQLEQSVFETRSRIVQK